MAKSSATLDKWRDYFRIANSDIFDIIEHAIMVAASDCPKEYKLRRDRIAEMLFTCKITRCLGCEKVELSVPNGDVDEDDDEKCRSEFDREFEGGGSKGSKVNSSRDDHVEMDMNGNQISNYSFGEAEALTDEIEEESQIFGEVLRIKEILDNNQDEPESILFDSLRRLQLMALSVETLKATEIGKSVNALRKHVSKQVRHLARTLIEGWKVMVDEWVNATTAITGTEGTTPESVKTSVVDEEEGLPSPPLDVGAFFTQATDIEWSQFFDGMDEDGNPRKSGEFNKNRENGRKPVLESGNTPKRKQQPPAELSAPQKDRKSEQLKKQEVAPKKQTIASRLNKPGTAELGPGRPPKPNVEAKVKNEMKCPQRTDKGTIQTRPVGSQQDKLKCSDDDAIQLKLEAAKRKLQERYQELENAKRQRTIQVMELRDIPKQGNGPKNSNMRAGSNNRFWAHGRR